MKSTQVPHTFCVKQPLAHHVHLWRNRHPKIPQIHGYTHGLDISLMLCSQLPPQCFNHSAMPDSSPHRYSTHYFWQPLPSYVSLCRNRHPKIAKIHGCICLFHYFDALNLCQSASIAELRRIQVHTSNPHWSCLTITSLTRVSVWDLGPNKYPKIAHTHEIPP